jgi:lysophospholipase L1-like esterase
MKYAFVFVAAAGLIAGCSSSSASSSSSPDAGPNAGPTETAQQVGAGTKFATYVILGDSISDRGGEGPFFYDLLGDDLKGKLGNVIIEKHSKAGAVSKQLLGQVKTIPTTLTGPVAVSVTIGGNDMQVASLDILQGKDDKERADFKANLTAAYDALLADGAFGAGVKVTLFHSTIYDPTDGKGNFAEAGCPGYLAAIPKTPTATFWDNWNKDAAEVLAKYGDAVVIVDTRAKFQGHGVGTAGTWFFDDCIHPNKDGHEALRELFLSSMEP